MLGGVTTYYVGNHFEWTGSQRVAMRDNNTLYYLLGDHLGSTAKTYNAATGATTELRYHPYGETRYTSGTTPTSYQFTGQRNDYYIKLYDMGARMYDPELGRFISADSIIPNPANPQSLNRYSYVYNSPLKYIDPSGHIPWLFIAIFLAGVTLEVNSSTPLPPGQVPPEQGFFATMMMLLPLATWYAPSTVATGGTLACGDGDCTNEVRAVGESLCADGNCTNELETAGRTARSVQTANLTGQRHHILSTKVMSALRQHDTLSGLFERNDIITQALDKASHTGYQTWHRAYDSEVVDWLSRHSDATQAEFLQYSIEIYSRDDMSKRFPDAVNQLQQILSEVQ